MPPRIGLYGLGSIGSMIASSLMERGYEIALAVDRDPRKVGKDLGTIAGAPPVGTTVSGSLDPAADCDIFIHSTSSRFRNVFPQISEIVEGGTGVISTCEELSCPHLRSPELARRIDELSRRKGVTVLGTGVNPGFLLDALPAFVAGVCRRVDSVCATRIVDAARRREPLQRKVGLGMDPRDFDEQAQKGVIGHVGLFESVALMAMAMGWELEEIRQDISPVVAERKLQTSYFSIGEGEVAGLHQEAIGTGKNAMIRLELEMSVEPDQPGDSVHLSGEPPIDLLIRGGVNGDTATVGRVVNHIPAVMVAPPGLATVLDIPISNGGSPVPAPKLTGRGRLL